MDKKDKWLKIRLTDQELMALRRIAENKGTGMSQIVRAQIRRSAKAQGLWE